MSHFWKSLPRPFSVLAPMEDVTDDAFREVIAQYLPRPDVFFTEFTSADGLCSAGRDRTIHRLRFHDSHRPIVAQIWGTKPKHMESAARLIVSLGFDGIDINMGCPVRAVIKIGAGSGLIRDQNRALSMIEAVKRGAGKLPVSVKTRLGYKSYETDTWIRFLLEQHLAVLTIHARTAIQLTKVPANWEEIGAIVRLRDIIAPDTIIIGNGDIESMQKAQEMHERYHADGVMIGRGIFKNPWVFEKKYPVISHTIQERVTLLTAHIKLYAEIWETKKKYDVLKKFFKIYISGFDDAAVLRLRLMETKTSEEALQILNMVEYTI